MAVRHVRRDGLDLLKKLEKDHKISEDEARASFLGSPESDRRHHRRFDKLLAGKEKEIMTV